MTPYKDAMLCHLHRLAKATTSQQFEKRLSDLKRSDVWTDSYGKVFKTWFENTWLAVKEVNFCVNFLTEKLCRSLNCFTISSSALGLVF
jgi:hypothetical protein